MGKNEDTVFNIETNYLDDIVVEKYFSKPHISYRDVILYTICILSLLWTHWDHDGRKPPENLFASMLNDWQSLVQILRDMPFLVYTGKLM